VAFLIRSRETPHGKLDLSVGMLPPPFNNAHIAALRAASENVTGFETSRCQRQGECLKMEAIVFELATVTLYPGLVRNIFRPLHAINLMPLISLAKFGVLPDTARHAPSRFRLSLRRRRTEVYRFNEKFPFRFADREKKSVLFEFPFKPLHNTMRLAQRVTAAEQFCKSLRILELQRTSDPPSRAVVHEERFRCAQRL
jgi:hypothetical protein